MSNTEPEYITECKVNSDCDSGVCKMIYNDEEQKSPKGRFCLGPNLEEINCITDNDCIIGDCVPEYNRDGHLIKRICKEDGKSVDKNSIDYDRENKYLYNSTPIAKIDKMVEDRNGGPIAKFIVILMDMIVVVCKLVITTLWSIFMIIFNIIAGTTLDNKKVKGDLIFGIITQKYKNDGKCVSMWLPRMVLTILLPPFGVFMAKGFRGLGNVILCCLLTMLFYFPGLLYAIIVMNNSVNAKDELIYMKCKGKVKDTSVKAKLVKQESPFFILKDYKEEDIKKDYRLKLKIIKILFIYY